MHVRLEHLPANIFGLGPLSRAALAAGPDFAHVPVARRIADIARRTPPDDLIARESLVRGMRGGLKVHEPPARVETSLNLLEREGTYAVLTGQQPGFLVAPLYSLYKALQACRLAQELSAAWGAPVVPIFWNHADDHDVAEVHHAWILNRNYDLQKLALAGLSSGRQPISQLALTDEQNRLGALRSSLVDTYGDHEKVQEALELYFPREGESLAAPMTRALTRLFGEHGLVVVEPDWIRAELARALAGVVGRGPAAALEKGVRDLRAGGFEPIIDLETAALVYRVDEDGRRALRIGGEGFRYDGESGSRTPAELAAEILQEPAAWSAGALLRPIVQDTVFPTVAYVGGYGELAYHAQLGPLRDGPAPAFAPRVSCTLVDAETQRSLASRGLELADVLRARGLPEEETEPRPPVIDALEQVAKDAARALRAQRDELVTLDPSLDSALERTADKLKGLVKKLVEKAERVQANKSGSGRRHQRRLAGTLFPRGKPQERVLGPLQFDAVYGREWLDALYDEWPALSPEHLVAHLEGDSH